MHMNHQLNERIRSNFAQAIRLDVACTLESAETLQQTSEAIIENMTAIQRELQTATLGAPQPMRCDQAHTYPLMNALAHIMNANRAMLLGQSNEADIELRHAQAALIQARRLVQPPTD